MRDLTPWTPTDQLIVDATPPRRFSDRRWLAWWAWAFLHFTIGYLVRMAVCSAR